MRETNDLPRELEAFGLLNNCIGVPKLLAWNNKEAKISFRDDIYIMTEAVGR